MRRDPRHRRRRRRRRDDDEPLRGRPARRERAGPRRDGKLDTRIDYTYDRAGRRTALTRDDAVDGSANFITRYTWDDAGRLVAKETDRTGDGTRVDTWRFSFDDAGRVVGADVVEGGDARRYRITRDAKGHEVTREVLRGDVASWRVGFERDDAGRPTAQTWDGDHHPRSPEASADGRVDRRCTFTVDAAGRELTRACPNVDGAPALVMSHTWDDAGRLVARTWHDASGKPDDCERIERDARGNELRRERDRGCDGTVDSTTVRRYDAEGRLVERRLERSHTSRPERVERWTYEGAVAPGQCGADEDAPATPLDTVDFGAM